MCNVEKVQASHCAESIAFYSLDITCAGHAGGRFSMLHVAPEACSPRDRGSISFRTGARIAAAALSSNCKKERRVGPDL